MIHVLVFLVGVAVGVLVMSVACIKHATMYFQDVEGRTLRSAQARTYEILFYCRGDETNES